MISIVIPAYNESGNIFAICKKVNEHLIGSRDFEIIFVDGGSSDNTLEMINRSKAGFKHELKILGAHRGRGNQMNKGAKAAKGNILLFLFCHQILLNITLTLCNLYLKIVYFVT